MKSETNIERGESKRFTLSELAAETGLPERTIRYYIARGVMAGPLRNGRGAVYTKEHLGRLQAVRELQGKGLTLAEIARLAETGSVRLPEPQAWWSYPIAPDVTVQVREGTSPWRTKQVAAAIAEFARRVATGER